MPTQTEKSVQGTTWSQKFVDSLPNSSFAYVNGDVRKLPYKAADGKVDLPHVRNALARLNQTQGIPDDEKSKIRTKLQGALKNTKAADDMVLRTTNAIQADDSGSTLPTRVHLLREGDFNTQKYGEVPIEAADLYEMKFNFERGVGMANDGETGIPIDFAHQSHLNAAGWIRSLDVVQADDGTELWGSNVEWSDSGKAALAGKEYKCLSSDFYPKAFGEWVDPESGVTAQNVIVGAGLTNRPMFTGNKPVIASDGEAEATGVKTVIYVSASNESKNKETSMNLDELRVKAADDLTVAEGIFIGQHASDLSEPERKKFGLEAAVEESEEDKKKAQLEADAKKKAEEEEAAKKAAQVNADANVTADAALKAAQDTIKELQASVETLSSVQKKTEHDKIQEEVEAHATRGAIKPDQIETFVTSIEAADEKTAKGLRASLSALADNPLLGKQFGSTKTEGSAAMDVEAEITKKVIERVEAAAKNGNTLDVFQARREVLNSDHDLAARASASAQAAMTSFNPFEDSWGAGAKGLQNVNPEVAR